MINKKYQNLMTNACFDEIKYYLFIFFYLLIFIHFSIYNSNTKIGYSYSNNVLRLLKKKIIIFPFITCEWSSKSRGVYGGRDEGC